MMNRLLFLIIFLTHATLCSAQEQKVAIIDIFDIREEISDSSRAVSFALWFNDQIQNSGEGNDLLNQTGFNINALAKALAVNPMTAEAVSREFDFYTEQELPFRDKLEKFVRAELPSIRKNFEKILIENPLAVVIMRTDKKQEFQIGIKNSGLEKMKLKNIAFSNKNVDASAPFVLNKPSGKSKKTNLKPLLIFQSYNRTDMMDVPIEIKIGNITASYSLKKITTPKPYIRKFFSSAKSTIEGEKITLTWEVLGAKNVILNNEIGVKNPKWQLMYSPISTTEFVISATNESGTSAESIVVEIERIVLVSANITYFSANNADPKEKGTAVALRVYDMDSREVASHTGLSDLKISSEIPYIGPFELTLNGTIYKRDLKKGNFKVDITSDQKDDWTFSPILILNYSDGSQNKLYGYGNKSISAGGQAVQFDF